MKSSFCSVCLIALACFLTAGIAPAQTYDIEENPYVEGVYREPIVPYEQPVSLDDALVLIGRAADVNVIADATDFPADLQVQPFPETRVAREAKWDNKLGNVVGDLREQGKLTSLRYADRTLLFWHEPELIPLARLIVASGILSSVPQSSQLFQTAYKPAVEYAQKSHNWNGEEPFTLETTFSRLSPELQSHLEMFRKSQALSSRSGLEQWLNDDIWKSARLVTKQVRGVYLGDANSNAMHTVLMVTSFDAEDKPLEANYGLFLLVN